MLSFVRDTLTKNIRNRREEPFTREIFEFVENKWSWKFRSTSNEKSELEKI